MTKVIIINGKGGSGKDTLIELTKDLFDGKVIKIDHAVLAKKAYQILGWKGEKSKEDRAVLEYLTDVSSENGFVFKVNMEFIERNIFLSQKSGVGKIIFICCRKESHIKEYVKNLKKLGISPTKVFVNSFNKNLSWENKADRVHYQPGLYDYEFKNTKDSNLLQERLKEFKKRVLE
jgi:hypothetical protein